MEKVNAIVAEELHRLNQKYPGKTEFSVEEWAEHLGYRPTYGLEKFRKVCEGPRKINYIRVGRKIIITIEDFARWMAQNKVIDGKPAVVPQLNPSGKARRKRGYTFD